MAQYHEPSASGLIPERTELTEGILFGKATKSSIHTQILNKLYRFFADRLDGSYLRRKEHLVTLVTSEPEPYLSIVKGRPRNL